MNAIKKYFTPFITGIILLTLSSCTAPPTNRESGSTNLLTGETVDKPLTTQLDETAPKPAQPQTKTSTPALSFSIPGTGNQATSTTAQATNTTTLNVYQADNQCQTLVPEKVAISAESPANAAVGKVLEKAASGDLDLAGYRVSINDKTRVATVDLRLAPNSQRQFISLSTCQQFALFGSLRKTLLGNAQLKIKDVRFTEQGQEIYF
jgi:hypothetical protein